VSRGGHGPQQRCGGDELLARSRGRIRVVDIEVGVDAVTGLPGLFARAFAARGGFSCHGGTEQPHGAVLFRQLGLDLTCLGQLRVDIGPCRWRGGRGAWPRGHARPGPQGGRKFPVAGARCTSGVCWVVGDNDAALPRGIVASRARVVRIAEPIVHDIEEPPEHYWVRHAGEIPFRVPVRGGGWQRVERA
jgi:hypothetical protein